MGIQINGQTDTISATDGSFTVSGASGDLIGNLTGNVTGDVTGNLTGTASTASNLAAGATLTIGAGSTSAPSLAPSGDSNTGIFFPSADTIAFAQGGFEASRIDSSGRLLVGLTNSSANVRAVFQSNSAGSAGAGVVQIARGNTFTASGTNIGNLEFTDSDGNIFGRIQCESDAATVAGSDHPGRITFETTADSESAPTERMRINNQGRTTLTSSENTWRSFTLTNNANVSGNGTYHSMLGANCNDTSSYHFVGNTSSDKILIYGNGDIKNTNGSYTSLSDAKLKENIVDAGSQWDDIKAIQIRNWNFKAETGHQTHRQIGPIAQELETVCPGLVFETPDRDADGNETSEVTKGVNQSVLYMKAVKALQEAMERIETLETANASLEARLTALEAQ